MTPFADYAAARRYLDAFVPGPGVFTPPPLALARTQALMTALGDPQDTVPVVHLAGTSGKGSTAAILAAILHAHGLKVGLGLSPHVQDLRERIQINGQWIDPATFAAVLGEMTGAIAHVAAGEFGPPTFFEILIALSYQWFAAAPVDIVVMETGLGGRYDATNVVHGDKLALLTRIGYDHMELLGDTLGKIAHAKAGIICPQRPVISMPQLPDAAAEIEAECRAKDAPLTWFDPEAIHHIRVDAAGVTFDWDLDAGITGRDLRLALTGTHQTENAALAMTAAQRVLAARGMVLDEGATRRALTGVTLPARMEARQWRGHHLILDGAHNPAKMHALCTALADIYPGQRFTFVLALKTGKEHPAILAEIAPYAAQILITQFHNDDQGMVVEAADPASLGTRLDAQGFHAWQSYSTVDLALAAAVHSATRDPIVVTGSIYLMAEVYAALGETLGAARF